MKSYISNSYNVLFPLRTIGSIFFVGCIFCQSLFAQGATAVQDTLWQATDNSQPPSAPSITASAQEESFWPPRSDSRQPPAPWKPIEIAGLSARVTEKLISLSDSGLPARLMVSNQSLITEPMEISIGSTPFHSVNHSAITLVGEGDRAEFSSHLTTRINDHDIDLFLSGVIEYDGLVSLSIESPNLPRENSLPISYRISYDENMGKFVHRPGNVGERNIELSNSPTITSSYLPFVWVGNDTRGLFWLSESARGWKNSEDHAAIQLRKTSGRWVLQITIQPQLAPDGTWRHRFGLMPTPVKALPKQWRKWRLLPASKSTAYIVWPNETDAQFSYFGYPESKEPTKFTRYVSDLKRGGVIAAPYACPTWIATNAPEWQRYQKEWYSGVDDNSFDQKQWGGRFVNVCSASRSWQNFAKSKFGKFIDQYHLRGIYMDNAQIYATRNCLGNSSPLAPLEFPMLPQRDIYRSIVESLRRNSEETFAVVHSSGGVNAPSFSSVDAWVNGEQYRDKVKRDYLDVASITDFRVELNGAQWGFIPIFLPEFNTEIAKEIAPTRKLMSILLLHDAIPWPQWANVEEINRGLALLDKFDATNAEFIPYYATPALATMTQPGMYVSGYRRNNESLLIVANLSRQKNSDRLCLPRTQFATGIRLQTWPDGTEQPLTSGCASIDIDAGAYTMYLVSQNQAKP